MKTRRASTGTRQLIIYADEVNISSRNIHAVRKNNRDLGIRE